MGRLVFIEKSESLITTLVGYTYLGEYKYTSSNGHSFFQSNTATNWSDAKLAAEAAGGYLAIIKSEDENDSIALTSIINTLSGLTECRTKRIYLSNEEIPTPIMKLLIFMSIILVTGFIFLGVENF